MVAPARATLQFGVAARRDNDTRPGPWHEQSNKLTPPVPQAERHHPSSIRRGQTGQCGPRGKRCARERTGLGIAQVCRDLDRPARCTHAPAKDAGVIPPTGALAPPSAPANWSDSRPSQSGQERAHAVSGTTDLQSGLHRVHPHSPSTHPGQVSGLEMANVSSR